MRGEESGRWRTPRDELLHLLDLHRRWSEFEDGGARLVAADLDLSDLDLAGVDLSLEPPSNGGRRG